MRELRWPAPTQASTTTLSSALFTRAAIAFALAATHTPVLTTMVGRERALSLLARRASAGRGMSEPFSRRGVSNRTPPDIGYSYRTGTHGASRARASFVPRSRVGLVKRMPRQRGACQVRQSHAICGTVAKRLRMLRRGARWSRMMWRLARNGLQQTHLVE